MGSATRDFDAPPAPCFILGIAQRSGTNYLFRLLQRHPDCLAPGPIWEDFLLHDSELLARYADGVVARWNPDWGVADAVGDADTLLGDLGAGLVRFLGRQAARAHASAPAEAPRRVFLTKTPSVRGLEHFPRLFPGARALVLVRDGRAVVESGVRSFGWRYEDAMHQWAVAAARILEFTRRHAGPDSPVRLVRYEDLVADEEQALTRIFAFLGLDPGRYDFAAASAMGVTGSSELRGRGVAVHWKEEDKTATFDPLRRHAGWNRRRQARFAWLAGAQMAGLGYAPDVSARPVAAGAAWHRMLDLFWAAHRRARWLAGAARRRLAKRNAVRCRPAD